MTMCRAMVNSISSFDCKIYRHFNICILILVSLLISHGISPVFSFVLPDDGGPDQSAELSKETSLFSKNGPQASEDNSQQVGDSVTESDWIREFLELDAQDAESGSSSNGDQSQGSGIPSRESGITQSTSINTLKPKTEKPVQRATGSGSAAPTKQERSSLKSTATGGYLSLEERIAEWLLAKRKEEHSQQDEEPISSPIHRSSQVDHSSYLLHADKSDAYGNHGNPYPYEEHQLSTTSHNQGNHLDDSLHAYHFNSGFMNNGGFPSFDSQENFKNFMEIGKTKRMRGYGKPRNPYDHLENKRGSKDPDKSMFVYYYDPDSHYGSSDLKPSYPFFEKEYGMDDLYPFDGMVEKEKRMLNPKSPKKISLMEKETNSFFTLDNHVDSSSTTKVDVPSRTNKAPKVSQDKANKPSNTKQTNAKKPSTSGNPSSNAKKNKPKVASSTGDSSSNRTANLAKKLSTNNDTKVKVGNILQVLNVSTSEGSISNSSLLSRQPITQNQSESFQVKSEMAETNRTVNSGNNLENDNKESQNIKPVITNQEITIGSNESTSTIANTTSRATDYVEIISVNGTESVNVILTSATDSQALVTSDKKEATDVAKTSMNEVSSLPVNAEIVSTVSDPSVNISSVNSTLVVSDYQSNASDVNESINEMTNANNNSIDEKTEITKDNTNQVVDLSVDATTTGQSETSTKPPPNAVAAATSEAPPEVNSERRNVSLPENDVISEMYEVSYNRKNNSMASHFSSTNETEKQMTELPTGSSQNITMNSDVRLNSTGVSSLLHQSLESIDATRRQEPLNVTHAPVMKELDSSTVENPKLPVTAESNNSVGYNRKERVPVLTYEKLYASSSNASEEFESKVVKTNESLTDLKNNQTGHRVGEGAHLLSLTGTSVPDKRTEEMGPKGTEREEKSMPNGFPQPHLIEQVSNKTAQSHQTISEDLLARLDLPVTTTESVSKETTATPVRNLTTDHTKSGASFSTSTPALGSGATASSPEQNQKTHEAAELLPLAEAQNLSVTLSANGKENELSSERNSNVTVNNTLQAFGANNNSYSNSTRTVFIQTNSSNRDNITNHTVHSSEESPPQQKNFISSSNVSRKLFSLDQDESSNVTDSNNTRKHVERQTTTDNSQTIEAREMDVIHNNHTTNQTLSGIPKSIRRLNETENVMTNRTIDYTTPTMVKSNLQSNTSFAANLTTMSTTTSESDIMYLPEALPNTVNRPSAVHENPMLPLQMPEGSLNLTGLRNETSSFLNHSSTLDDNAAKNNSLHHFLSSIDTNSTVIVSSVDVPKSANNDNISSYLPQEDAKGDTGKMFVSVSTAAKDQLDRHHLETFNSTLRNSSSVLNDSRVPQTIITRPIAVTGNSLQHQDVISNDFNTTSHHRRSSVVDVSEPVNNGVSWRLINGSQEMIINATDELVSTNATTRMNSTIKGSESAGSQQFPDLAPERDVPPISTYMVQDFSLRKPSTETKGNKQDAHSSSSNSHSSKPKDVMAQNSNIKDVTNNGSSSSGNLTSRAAELNCLGPACDLTPISAVSRSQAAVSAVLTSHFGPAKDIMIPFDLELLDLSDNYDNSTGMFICTVPGTYVISLYLMSHPGAKVNARIFVNNRPIAALWADDAKGAGFYPSSSTQTIAQLGFGDQVYVMLVDGGYGDSWVHANYNVFTIFLLYEQIF